MRHHNLLMMKKKYDKLRCFFSSHQSRNWLADLVAEHLDHLHYLNDILCINNDALNGVLTEHFLNRLLIPLYIYSLTMRKKQHERAVSMKYMYDEASLIRKPLIWTHVWAPIIIISRESDSFIKMPAPVVGIKIGLVGTG